jgi:hypothetical protein
MRQAHRFACTIRKSRRGTDITAETVDPVPGYPGTSKVTPDLGVCIGNDDHCVFLLGIRQSGRVGVNGNAASFLHQLRYADLLPGRYDDWVIFEQTRLRQGWRAAASVTVFHIPETDRCPSRWWRSVRNTRSRSVRLRPPPDDPCHAVANCPAGTKVMKGTALPGRDPWSARGPSCVRNGRGHGQSQRRNLMADLNQAWGASVPQGSCGRFGSSAGASGKPLLADASVSAPMSCGAPISESMIHPPIVHEALQLVMKV